MKITQDEKYTLYDAIYGDDALAESDFYTPFELAPRMKQVDKFLDTPRMLDGLSPTIEKRLPDPSVPPITKTAEPATQTAKEQPTAAAASEPDRRASVPQAAEQPASGATATAAETETSNANAITDTAPLAVPGAFLIFRELCFPVLKFSRKDGNIGISKGDSPQYQV